MERVTEFTLKEQLNERINSMTYSESSRRQNEPRISSYYGELAGEEFTDLMKTERAHILNR